MSPYPGEIIDAGLSLLDHQIVDCDGKMAGNVDDLELTLSEDGGPPICTAILSGPGALGNRVGGKLGRWIESVHQRLHHLTEPGPSRISFGVVKRIGPAIELSVPKRDLDISTFEDWVRDRIIAKIPGSRRETPPEGGG